MPTCNKHFKASRFFLRTSKLLIFSLLLALLDLMTYRISSLMRIEIFFLVLVFFDFLFLQHIKMSWHSFRAVFNQFITEMYFQDYNNYYWVQLKLRFRYMRKKIADTPLYLEKHALRVKFSVCEWKKIIFPT